MIIYLQNCVRSNKKRDETYLQLKRQKNKKKHDIKYTCRYEYIAIDMYSGTSLTGDKESPI